MEGMEEERRRGERVDEKKTNRERRSERRRRRVEGGRGGHTFINIVRKGFDIYVSAGGWHARRIRELAHESLMFHFVT